MDRIGREVHHAEYAVALHLAHESHQAILGVVLDLDERTAPLARLQRAVAVLQQTQQPVQLREAPRTGIDHRIAVEEGERMVVAELLPRIDERHRLRQHERQRGHDSGRIAQPAELAAVPRILVVIGGEHQPHGRTRITVAVGVKVVAHGRKDPPARLRPA